LREIAPTIIAAERRESAGPAAANWADAALSRLYGLVRIRRLDAAAGAATTDAGATVKSAERALAGGDLAGAVAALDPLTGSPGEVAQPWLRMARDRLAVETSLDRIAALLTVRLGAANALSVAPPR